MKTENRSKHVDNRYLPILSLALLGAVAGLALRLHLARPPAHIRRKVAAFQSALEVISLHYEDIDLDVLFQGAMHGLVEGLGDPYSRYLSRSELEQADAEVEGRFGGVGVVVQPAEGAIVIIELLPGGAAMQADLSPGDRIVGVDGMETVDMPFAEVVSSIRGRPGTRVRLTVKERDSGEEKTLELERRMLDLAPVEWELMPGGIGMIRLRSFSIRSTVHFREALDSLLEDGGMKALILDLRDNPGGLLDASVTIADMFLSGGRIVGVKGANKRDDRVYEAKDGAVIPTDLPMAVLVNERSASASELLAGALQSNRRAAIIGTGTVGKGAVDSLFELPDGSGLVLKVADYTVGDDIKVEGRGIEPDMAVGEMPPPPYAAGVEELHEWILRHRQARQDQERHAVEYLREMLAAD